MMSYSKRLCCPRPDCYPDICPQPFIDARNEPCVTSCGDSTAVVCAPPVVVKFPGAILSTYSQDSFVGTTMPNLPARPGGYPAFSGGVNGSIGSGVSYGSGYGVSYGSGYGASYGGAYGACYGGDYSGGYGGSCGSGRKSNCSISICGGRYSGSTNRNCGPC